MVSQNIHTGCPNISIHGVPIHPYRVSQYIYTWCPNICQRWCPNISIQGVPIYPYMVSPYIHTGCLNISIQGVPIFPFCAGDDGILGVVLGYILAQAQTKLFLKGRTWRSAPKILKIGHGENLITDCQLWSCEHRGQGLWR